MEASTWQVEELCHESDESKQLQDANVAREAEPEGENQCFSEQEVDQRRQCECQEFGLNKYWALDVQRQKREARSVGQLERALGAPAAASIKLTEMLGGSSCPTCELSPKTVTCNP